MNDPAFQALMIPLLMVVFRELDDDMAQGVFIEQDHLIQTFVFDRTDKSLGICIKIGRSPRQ